MEEVRLGHEKVLLTIVQDITRQKQNEWRVEGVRELLELFATKTSRQDYVESVVRFLRDWSGCRCAGIRLLDQRRAHPLRRLRRLQPCLPQAGKLPFAGHGRLSLQRASSAAGRWRATRNSRARRAPFSATTPAASREQFCADAAKRAQVACLQAGYDSLAHAPIRYQGRLLGTIHLADPREDRFPPETISFIESVAPLIGEALHRFQVEESLVESEQRFRSMFERHDGRDVAGGTGVGGHRGREPGGGGLLRLRPGAFAGR